MTKGEVLQILREHFESLFPKVCANCNRRFRTLREYILNTSRIGIPVSYDAEFGDWNTRPLIGTLVLANCPCGSTMALSTETMELALRLELLNWVRDEVLRRGVSLSELLECLRSEVRELVSSDLTTEGIEHPHPRAPNLES